MSLFARALLAFLALPGMVAYAAPLGLAQWQGLPLAHAIGLLPVVVGSGLLLWCVRDFYVAGHGTLAPWSPPRRLVVIGLYRFSRNPMYLSVSVVLLGWAAAFASVGLLLYALGVVLAFQLRVVLGEEPWLVRTHGDEWAQYAARVRRWL